MRRLRLMTPNERIDATHFQEIFEHIEHLAQQIGRLLFNGTAGILTGFNPVYATDGFGAFLNIGSGWAVDADCNVVTIPSTTSVQSDYIPATVVSNHMPAYVWCAVGLGQTGTTAKKRVKWNAGAEASFSPAGGTRNEDRVAFTVTANDEQPADLPTGEKFFKSHRITGWIEAPAGVWNPTVVRERFWTLVAPGSVEANDSLYDWLLQMASTLTEITGNTYVTESPVTSLQSLNTRLEGIEEYLDNYETYPLSQGRVLLGSPIPTTPLPFLDLVTGHWKFSVGPLEPAQSIALDLQLRQGERLYDVRPFVDSLSAIMSVQLWKLDPTGAVPNLKLAEKNYSTLDNLLWVSDPLDWVVPGEPPHVVDTAFVYRILVNCSWGDGSLRHIRYLRIFTV